MADGFNSEEYHFCEMTIVAGGRPLAGALGIKYKITREVNHIYAKGRDPHARNKGKATYAGSLKLLQSEGQALEEAAPDGDVTKLTLKITVAYAPELGGTIKTDHIINVDFTDYEKGMFEGDTNMTIEMPFKAGKIKFNV
ncbi:MAG: hypothetical protein EAY68_10040 [Bacteroidetes bacterium]|nr:MAG: hypothetical protein EAY68_10040 [Bacteroidota bacterium]